MDDYKHKLSVLEEHCRVVGRDPNDIQKSFSIIPVVGYHRDKVEAMAERAAAQRQSPREALTGQMIVGTPEECATQLRPYVDLGVDLFLISMRAPYDYDTLRLFAEKVMPMLREWSGR